MNFVFVTAPEIAKTGCNRCHSSGIDRNNQSLCKCTEKGYDQWLKRAVKTPCPFCDRVGSVCEHRPKTREEYLALLGRAESEEVAEQLGCDLETARQAIQRDLV